MKRDRWHVGYGTVWTWAFVFWLGRGSRPLPGRDFVVGYGSLRLSDRLPWGWSQVGKRRRRDMRRFRKSHRGQQMTAVRQVFA